MNNYIFRLVREEDVSDILNIYEPYVRDTAITFEVEPPTLEVFANRVKHISAQYPYIVCALEGNIIGYAYAHRHMERDAYQWNAELSIYIDSTYHSGGIGRKLYSALMEILKLQNVKNVYGGVTSPNEKSEKLHAAFGFKKIGTYPNTGYKCGAWHDVVWFEKTIGTYDAMPVPFIPIGEVDARAVCRVLERCGL